MYVELGNNRWRVKKLVSGEGGARTIGVRREDWIL